MTEVEYTHIFALPINMTVDTDPAWKVVPKGKPCFIIWRIEVGSSYLNPSIALREHTTRVRVALLTTCVQIARDIVSRFVMLCKLEKRKK